ncbi:hypothetical protein BDW71DRAFT_212673 [Aspergillus fruticulosus]
MALKLWLPALLALAATAPGLPHTTLSTELEPRDAGDQPICLLISSILRGPEDLIAKIRPRDGLESCGIDQHQSSRTLQARQADPNDPYSCDESNPCSNGACCAKTGVCGYGEDYCGETGESPNEVCWSNCDAVAECGRHSSPAGKECPLNVCCSQYGFCGMTEEFCTVTDDEETSCQSNCEQPGSGSSGGDVQTRIIGYYEAWNHAKRCIGMKIQDIPIGSLTHIYYSFGYIRPETYEIVPMDDEGELSTDTFTEFAGLKRKNPGLKVVIALGGWTFNDNGTIWQPVFSDLASTEEKRGRFIDQVLTFMNRYGFDGVDIDWEYPGAGDRGGHEGDGENLTKLMKQMRTAFDKSSTSHLEISFTAPTSYWYLRHFDIKASAEAADFVNLMAYDLHGVWDANNPIGSQVLAHTNLTEINRALDLFWRNDVPANKINMGLGFYGRSFQLADPGCYQPGCLFLGGATPGPCTNNSGTLSYFEIMDIIDEYDLTPYYDEENGVKWITWNGDQWVSYDDYETFQQKISFANGLGLGGLLIWAVDLDTQQLDALEAVIYPEPLGSKGAEASIADTWEEAGESHCRVTECGYTGCRPGEIEITQTQCTDEDFWTGEYSLQSTCCPFASAPSAKDCTWEGNEPFCNGQCHPGEVALQSSLYGDWGKCLDGRKFLCCPAAAQMPDCRWTECGDSCSSNENEMTWRYGGCGGDEKKKFCCSKEEDWQNCEWHGKPGSCFDNHCDTGWQVALTTAYEGEGDDCGFWHSERQRSFCCDPPDNSSPFMPVPLEYLFPEPPSEEEADTDFTLKVDPTYGGASPVEFADDPENAPFGFVVLTSPDELQVSLDRRDGSHWEVFDCFDAVTEGEHTVRMMCSDLSEDSNCHKIHLGHGAPGTILEMPKGCGPGKYAVAKSLTPSANQTLPDHLVRRGLDEPVDTIYDLTFDYNFKRVPRDLGNTQIRIDFSNEPEYWGRVVDKAATVQKRNKRSLADAGGNYRRWLEEEWRDDAHYGGLSREELHKRWFGSGVIDWLKGLLNGVSGGLDIGHSFEEDFIVQLIDQRLSCPNVEAKLDVHAETHVGLDVHYGFTLIATLGSPIDFSNSYLYFRSKGEVTAKFVVDASVTALFDTGDILLFSADKFGAAFSVPGIVTIGPNFKLFGQLEGSATLGVNFESRVALAEWDVRQTYPVENDDWDPEALEDANKDGTQNVLEPEFEYGFSLSGHLSAHIKPTLTFGIGWNEDFISIDSCAVNLVADGHVTFHAELESGSGGTSFCYGIDAGADLYATVDAPSAFDWALPSSPFEIVPIDDVQIYPSGGSPACWTPDSSKSKRKRSRSLDAPHKFSTSGLDKRAQVYGPLVPRLEGLSCPGSTNVSDIPPCPLCGSDESVDSLTKRDGESCWLDPYFSRETRCPLDAPEKRDLADAEDGLALILDNTTYIDRHEKHTLSKRANKGVTWSYNGEPHYLPCGTYQSCGRAAQQNVHRWFGFRGSEKQCSPIVEKLTKDQTDTSEYVTEHVYEAHLLKAFMLWLTSGPLPAGYSPASYDWVSEVLIGIEPAGGGNSRAFAASSWVEGSLFFQMTYGLGGDHNLAGLVLADGGINGRKVAFFEGGNPDDRLQATNLQTRLMHRNTAGVFSYMRNTMIWNKFRASSQHMEKTLHEFDTEYQWSGNGAANQGQIDLPQRAANQPTAGLRDLYCYWIDQLLGEIEANGVNWVRSATANYRASSYASDNAGRKWLDNVLNSNGLISESSMRFLRAANQHRAPNAQNPSIWAQSRYENLWRTGQGYGAAGPF